MKTIAKIIGKTIGVIADFGIVTLVAFILTKVGIIDNLGSVGIRIIIAIILAIVSTIINNKILKKSIDK